MKFPWALLSRFLRYLLKLAVRIRAIFRNHLGNPAAIAPAKNRPQEKLT
jgi:hypothetical protein